MVSVTGPTYRSIRSPEWITLFAVCSNWTFSGQGQPCQPCHCLDDSVCDKETGACPGPCQVGMAPRSPGTHCQGLLLWDCLEMSVLFCPERGLPIIPTPRWSDTPLVRRLIGPTLRWSDTPTPHWSDASLVRRVIGPTPHWAAEWPSIKALGWAYREGHGCDSRPGQFISAIPAGYRQNSAQWIDLCWWCILHPVHLIAGKNLKGSNKWHNAILIRPKNTLQ